MSTDDKKMKYSAPALEKGLEILEFLASSAEPLTQTDIAKGTNRNPNEIYRMLMCLDERGYISRDSATGCYQMTLKLYNLSHCHSPIEKLREAARPLMKKLSAFANQASHITVMHENQIMIVAPTLSPGPISVSMEEGRTYPLLATTSGRTLLAQYNPENRLQILQQLNEYQNMSEEAKLQELKLIDEINKNRYIVRKSTLTAGVTDIAVIIGSDSAPLKAALSLCCIESQLNRALETEELKKATIKTAEEIAKNIGSI